MNTQLVNFRGKQWQIFGRIGADQSIIAEIFRYQEYRCAEKIIIEAKDFILDVGAHIGVFILYCKTLNPTVKILALEPESENFLILQKNLSTNGIKNVIPIPAALSAKTGTAKFLITPDSHNHRLLAEEQPVQPKNQITSVKTISLTRLCQRHKIKKISLLKMDIEGGEYPVVESLKAADFGKIQNIILEYHNSREQNYRTIENQLRANGFSVSIFPSKFDPKLGFLLARNKRTS